MALASGPVVAIVWEGLNAVKTGRVMLGETTAHSKPGTIRGDFCVQVNILDPFRIAPYNNDALIYTLL